MATPRDVKSNELSLPNAETVAADELSDAIAATLAGEIARLDTLRQVFGERNPTFLAEAIRRGPLGKYVNVVEGDYTGEIALLSARARLAAHDARAARKPPSAPSAPPWLKSVFLAFVIPIAIGILVSLVTSQQQLTLYREQTSHDAMRKQGDVLLSQLSSIIVDASRLQNDVAFEEARGDETPSESLTATDLLKGHGTRLQTDFASTVRLHSFDAFPELEKTQLHAYHEILALLDCLERRAGQQPSGDWRKGESDEVLKEATSDGPCASNFDVNAFERFKDAVKQNVDARIGGALFPSRTVTN